MSSLKEVVVASINVVNMLFLCGLGEASGRFWKGVVMLRMDLEEGEGEGDVEVSIDDDDEWGI